MRCLGGVAAKSRTAVESMRRRHRWDRGYSSVGRLKYSHSSRPLRLCIIGFGHVGRALCESLVSAREGAAYPRLARLAREVSVVGILTRSRGGLANPSGVDMTRALQDVASTGRFSPHNPDFLGGPGPHGDGSAASELDFDVLVELSSLDITDNGGAARRHVQSALANGQHVVSANKGPIAFALPQLLALAETNGAVLRYESAVMDGAPVLNMARACLRGCRVLGVVGALNSTSTFVLDQMRHGRDFDSALQAAQDAGVAEEDPSHDLDGWDAACKLAILTNALALENPSFVTPSQVQRTPMNPLLALNSLASQSKVPRMVARMQASDMSVDNVEMTVRVEYLDTSDPMASLTGTGSCVTIYTDMMCPITVTQTEPKLLDTVYGVVNDLYEVLDFEASK